jgi:hypothetical protein
MACGVAASVTISLFPLMWGIASRAIERPPYRIAGLRAAAGHLRAQAHPQSQFAEATRGTIRPKLLKLTGLVRVCARRVKFALASACPYADEGGRPPRHNRLTRRRDAEQTRQSNAQPTGDPQKTPTSSAQTAPGTRSSSPRHHAIIVGSDKDRAPSYENAR